MTTEQRGTIALYVLAMIGAALSVAGDWAGVFAARGAHPLAHVVGVFAWAACYPVWFAMSRSTGGAFVEPALAWWASSAVISAAMVLRAGDRQTPLQWAGLAVIAIGALLRRIGAP